MLKLNYLFKTMLLLSVLALWSCSKNGADGEGPFLTPDPASLSFEASGNELTKSIAISSNRDWTAAFVENDAATWASIDAKSGSGNGKINVTVLPNDKSERSATLKLIASTVSVNVKITQLGSGGTKIDTLYFENCGTKVDKVDGKWPYTDQYAGWIRKGSLDQKDVVYGGKSSNVSNSGAAFAPAEGSKLSGAPYVGMNTAAAVFTIGNINITGKSNFTFKFGAIFQSDYQGGSVFAPVAVNTFKLYASVDGTAWAPLTYTVAKDGSSNWSYVSSEFKVPDGSAKLFIKYETSNLTANQGYRFDDFLLYEGGDGSVIVPEKPEDPGDKTYITVAQLRAKGLTTITDNVYVKANVISNKEGGNSTSLKNVVVSDGNAGIAIRFTANADFAVGTELELKLQGAQLAKYQGLLQLNNFGNDNAAATGVTNVLAAKSITAAQLLGGEFESMYVAVADVQVVTADLGKKMVEGGKHTNIGMEAKAGEKFSMFSSSYSVFKDSPVPQGSGILKGIAGINLPDGGQALYQVSPQTAEDFAALTGDRFGDAPSLSFQAPAFTATSIKAGEAIVDGKITIPYLNAAGTESYNITVAVSGDGSAGIDAVTSPVNKTLSAGNGTIEIPITGTPANAGNVTFTISGIEGLTNNTATGTVTAAGSVNMADFNTLTATYSYGERTTTAGWVALNAAVLQGGETESSPTFPFIGATADVKAVCLNGKTTAVGVLTSPVLAGGCGVITFNYGHAFSESNGVDIKIEIKKGDEVVKTEQFVKAKADVTGKTAYTHDITMNIAGEFRIVITNNSPSNSTSNKDRIAIWNLKWTNYK